MTTNTTPSGADAPGHQDTKFNEWYATKFKVGMERGPLDKYVARQAWFAALSAAQDAPAQAAPQQQDERGAFDSWIRTHEDEHGALDDSSAWAGWTGRVTISAQAHEAAPAPLLARIAELEAELEKTKAIFAASCNHAAVMEMDRDARRYRWLRKRWARLDESYADGGPKITSLRVLTDQEVKDEYGWDVDPESLDAAIDAAMKEQGHA